MNEARSQSQISHACQRLKTVTSVGLRPHCRNPRAAYSSLL